MRLRMRAYAEEVAKSDGTLHIISRAKHYAETTDGPLVLHGVGGSRLMALMTMRNRARALVRSVPISVVSAQDPFEHGLIAQYAVEGSNAKLHIQIHTDLFSPWFLRGDMKGSRTSFMNKVRLRIADGVLPTANGIRVVSQRIKDSLIARYGEKMQAVRILPIHVDTDSVSAVPLPQPAFPFTLITVGRLEPEKRMEDILYAIAGLKDEYPSVGLIIAGQGRERRKLEQLAQRLRIQDRVQFLGARTDARGLMQNAQAYIQASAYEGYGITLIEAALARVPMITTDVGIVGDVLKGNVDVLAAPPGDPAQLMQHIRKLVEDSRLRAELPMRAEASVKEHLAQTHSAPADAIADITRLSV